MTREELYREIQRFGLFRKTIFDDVVGQIKGNRFMYLSNKNLLINGEIVAKNIEPFTAYKIIRERINEISKNN